MDEQIEQIARAIAACDNEVGFDAWTANMTAQTVYCEYARAAHSVIAGTIAELTEALTTLVAAVNRTPKHLRMPAEVEAAEHAQEVLSHDR